MASIQKQLKVILLGDSSVGKTSLLYRFTKNVFQCELTIGAERFIHSLELDPGVSLQLELWGTWGLESVRELARYHYHHTDGCLLVFDLTNPDSFHGVKYWYDDICKTLEPDKVAFVLVGQKCDNVSNRKVDKEEAEQLAGEWGMPYVETSALTGHNVKELFQDLARRMKDKQIVEPNEHNLRLAQARTKKSNCF